MACLISVAFGRLLTGLPARSPPTRGEWLKRGLHCRKLVCPPCFQVETERGEVGVVAIQSGKHQVVIAVDPHKASWTAAAVHASLQPLARWFSSRPRVMPT